MDDDRASEFGQDLLDRSLIADVAFDNGQRLLADLLDAFECCAAAVGKVVEYHDLVAGIEQFDAGVGADIAGAAGHQNHWESPRTEIPGLVLQYHLAGQ